MNLYILNKNYERVGFIDQADSILWNKKYNDVGECEIYIPCSETMLNLLQNGYYVYREDDDMFCQIQNVEIETDVENGDYIIATAKDICTILAGRIVRWQITFSGKVCDYIKKLLTDNVINPVQTQRAISNFIIDESNFSSLTDTIEATTFTDDLLQCILKTCNTYNLGFRVSYSINTSQLVFKLYKGLNKATTQSEEYVEFSPIYSNIISSNYNEDESNYKNVVYVSYKTTNDEVYLLSYFNGSSEPSGESRKEIFVDGTGTSRDITYDELVLLFPSVQKSGTTSGYYYIVVSGEQVRVATFETQDTEEKITVTDYTYLILIRIIAQNALAENVKIQEFTGEVDTIDTYEYKKDYDLGDIVKVKNEYGIEANAMITEVMESDDNDNGYVVEPKFQYLN